MDVSQDSGFERIGLEIVQGLASGVIAVDGHDQILGVNPAALAHLELSADVLTRGRAMRDIPVLAPMLAILNEARASGEAVNRKYARLENDDGPGRELGISVSLLTPDGDAPPSAVFLFTDMTERRDLERAAELNQQLANLGELTAGVVHELRNPLTIVQGQAELMRRRFPDEPRIVSGTESIMHEVTHLANSIAQFLSFSKPFEIVAAPAQLQEIVDRALALCERQASAKQVNLNSGLPAKTWPVPADANRLAEALGNLVSNAIDAVDAQGTVTILVTQSIGATRLEVVDDGPGIDMEKDEDLFSPFLTHKHDGTGLGLSIVKRIVTAHRGTIRYENRKEGGARFIIQLPSLSE